MSIVKWKRRAIILIFSIGFTIPVQKTFAQDRNIPVEVLVGHRGFAHQMYMTKYLHEKSRFGYFGYLRYEASYAKSGKDSFTGQSLFFYDIAGKVSLGGGGYITNAGFVPQLAIAYGYTKGDFSLTGFASFEPVKSPNSELFILATYEPPLNRNNWKLFTQLITSYNFSYNRNLRYNFANQYLRLGLSHHEWQFGLGSDLVQENGSGLLPVNTGLFLRRLL